MRFQTNAGNQPENMRFIGVDGIYYLWKENDVLQRVADKPSLMTL